MAGTAQIRLAQAKQELIKEFDSWVRECTHTRLCTPKDMIEFLYQRGFIRGKKWEKFKRKIAKKNDSYCVWIKHEPMREGFIPPDTWV